MSLSITAVPTDATVRVAGSRPSTYSAEASGAVKAEGQVLLSFFATSRNMYAFLYSNEKYAAWHINSPVQLQKNIVNLLRELGNYDQNHEITPSDLAKTNWRSLSAKVAVQRTALERLVRVLASQARPVRDRINHTLNSAAITTMPNTR